MKLHSMLVPLALLPVVASAQTSVYSTNFSTAERASTNAAYDVGDWVLASTKAVTGIAYGTGAFNFGMAATTSGLAEAQNRFTATPVTLSSDGDWIQLKVKFTNSGNILGGANGSGLTLGLYDTGSSNPIAILTGGNNTPAGATTLSSTASSGNASGFAQNWEGYVGRFSNNGNGGTVGSNSVYTRPAQTGSTSSANQELMFNNVGGGSFGNTAGGATVGVAAGSTASSSLASLSASTQYVATMRITQASSTSYTIDYNLLDATETTNLQSISRTASGTSYISNLIFDGIAVGYRYSGTSGASSISLNSVAVTISAVAIPEPSTVASLAGLAVLGFAASRRRRA